MTIAVDLGRKATKQTNKRIWPFHFKLLFLSLHFVNWILRLINSMIELIDFMMQHFLPGVTLNMFFGDI